MNDAMLHDVYLGLGTNLGDKQANMQLALQNIEKRIGTLVACSAFYVTAPVGFDSDNQFLNAACHVRTPLTPSDVLKYTKQIEMEMGRDAKSVDQVYHDRIMDIDILFYDDLQIDTPYLTLPHPHIGERDFVLRPLSEIASERVEKYLNR